MQAHRLLLAISLGVIAQAHADSSRMCSQSHVKFLELARDYNNCNSVVGSSSESCNSFCDAADELTTRGRTTNAGSCSVEQIRDIQERARQDGQSLGRQQGREEVLKDLSIKEEFVSKDFFGINEDDCSRRVVQSSQPLRVEAIRRCNSKAESIRNCFIRSEQVSGSFGRPPKFAGNHTFKKDDNRSTQDECQRTALAEATSFALRQCSDATGSTCSIINSETILTHRIQQPSGPRLGRRDSRICDAKVYAEAPRDLAYKCNIRISARNQAFAN